MKALAEKELVHVDEWIGCYRGGWKGVICDEAFSHPAKVAFNLAKRIYEHAIDEQWIVRGDTVVDPFGGIGGCAFHGVMNGMIVVTNELEEKFVNLSKQNRELWRQKFTGLPGFDADNWIILQGDSRKLASVIQEAGLSVSSPPYVSGGHHTDVMGAWNANGGGHGVAKDEAGYGQSAGQLGAMKEGDLSLAVSSPPYASGEKGHPSLGSVNKDDWGNDGRDITRRRGLTGEYGSTEGNIAAMPEGQICVSSPPFPQPYSSGGGINEKGYFGADRKRDDIGSRTYQSKGGDRAEGNLETLKDGGFQAAISSPPYNPPMSQDHNGSRGGKRGTEPSETGAFVKYGNSEGQIEGLSMEGFADACVSSPPYEGTKGHPSLGHPELNQGGGNILERATTGNQSGKEWYGESEGQIQTASADTFWSASRTILEQLYSVLKPGAHAIFIVKAFVRDKQIVDFPAQWAQLCGSVGFKLIHDHHALLTEHSGTQGGMFGADKEYKVKRVSFFRRLHEKKSPETEIHYENVLCFERS